MPATDALASSWADPSAVPYVIDAGPCQVIAGVACETLIFVVALAVV